MVLSLLTMISPSFVPRIYVRGQELPATTVPKAIRLLAEEYAHLSGTPELAPALVESAWDREAMDPTYVGRSMAIPHARVEAAVPTGLYMARCRAGIPWPGENRASLIVFLAVSEEMPDAYLQMLSRLMRWRMKVDSRDLLGEAHALEQSLRQMWD